jgi:hypothetical protein
MQNLCCDHTNFDSVKKITKTFFVLGSFSEDCRVLESHEEQEGMFNVKTSLPWKTAVFKNILKVSKPCILVK